MFNHQYDFDIEIPSQVISKIRHDGLFTQFLGNKAIIGLCGYGKSGKDFIAEKFIEDYGFHRVAFADNIKIEMNEHLKEDVYNDIMQIKPGSERPNTFNDSTAYQEFYDLKYKIEDIDFQTEDLELKKVLRPYIIWYGEKLREINGAYYWINQALKIDAKGHDKIIFSDVRRIKELDIFKRSNSFNKKSMQEFVRAGEVNHPDLTADAHKPYSALLFHVSQFMLTDKDALTHECIRVAQENWMFDYAFHMDPRLKESGKFREKATKAQIKEVVDKFGIETPDKTIAKGRQHKLFN